MKIKSQHHTPTVKWKPKKINKWGNSLGVLLPKNVRTTLDLEQHDEIEFIFENGRIYIEKASSLNIPNLSLTALMNEYDTESDKKI